jgi:hypothetical protein
MAIAFRNSRTILPLLLLLFLLLLDVVPAIEIVTSCIKSLVELLCCLLL